MKTLRILVALALVLSMGAPALAQRRQRRPRRPSKVAPKPPAPKAADQQAVTTASGLTVVVTHRANGRMPKKGETVLVHYTGMLTDGTKFDSSHDRRDPIAFPLGEGAVIKGWDEGIAQLGVGDHAVLVIPPQLAYGEKGAGGVIPPNATLVFAVGLVDVKDSSLSQVLMKTLTEKGLAAAVDQYRALKGQGFGDVYASESELNTLGYRLLQQRKIAEAVEFLKLNVEAFPDSANAYDSLGEAYMIAGDKALAVENYQKSLELDPRNANAAQMLKKLEGE
jgi:hypothetical protein